MIKAVFIPINHCMCTCRTEVWLLSRAGFQPPAPGYDTGRIFIGETISAATGIWRSTVQFTRQLSLLKPSVRLNVASVRWQSSATPARLKVRHGVVHAL